MKHIVSSFIFLVFLSFSFFSPLKSFAQRAYTITPSHDTTIVRSSTGEFNKIIIDNTKNDKDVDIVIETIYDCDYTMDGAFFGVISAAIGYHINKTYTMHIAAHTTSENWNLYREQPDIIFYRDAGCLALGAFDADIVVKDSETILLREHLHTDFPIAISTDGKYGGGLYLISQVKMGSTECIPATFANNGPTDITITSIDNLDSDAVYSFSNVIPLPVTVSSGGVVKLFDACYTASGANFYSKQLLLHYDNGNVNQVLIGGTQCGFSAPASIWQIHSAVAEQPDRTAFTVTPNPSSGSFTVTTPLAGAQLEMFDILGNTICSEKIGESYKWNGKAAPGAYYIRVKGLGYEGKLRSEMKKVLLY